MILQQMSLHVGETTLVFSFLCTKGGNCKTINVHIASY